MHLIPGRCKVGELIPLPRVNDEFSPLPGREWCYCEADMSADQAMLLVDHILIIPCFMSHQGFITVNGDRH